MQPKTIFWSERDLKLVGEKRAAAAPAHTEAPPAPSIASKADAAARKFTFVLSSDRADRSGDVINQNGWDLREFQRNPVALFAHNSASMPIGRWSNLRLVGNKMLGDLSFASTPRAREARDLTESGFLKACSVGFVPGVWSWINNKVGAGINFETGHSLLEVSLCAIGCNPDALLQQSFSDNSKSARRLRELELLRLQG